MKNLFKISLILVVLLSFNSCDNSKKTSDKEKELLKKEVELLKKEKELLNKTETSTIKTETIKTEPTKTVVKNNKKEKEPKKSNLNTETKKTIIANKYQIGQNNAGQFVKGKKAPTSLPNNFLIEKKTRLRAAEGDEWEEEYFLVSENGNELITYTMGHDYETKRDNVISEIIIQSDQFRTTNNIGINSTIEEFMKAYPDFSIWSSNIGDFFTIQTKTMKAQFLLDNKDFVSDWNILDGETTNLKKTDFKINSKIKTIRIY